VEKFNYFQNLINNLPLRAHSAPPAAPLVVLRKKCFAE